MQINVIIKHKEHCKTLLIISEITYKLLYKFINKCPKKYKHIIDRIVETPNEISMNKKFKTLYGQACFKIKNNKINVLTIEYAEDLVKLNKKEIKLIVAHELAHSIDYLLRGFDNDFKHHDKEWQKIAVLLGAQPYPTIDITENSVKI